MLTLLFMLATGLNGLRLTDTLGRNEFRIYSEPFPILAGRSVFDLNLEARLKRRHYQRVHSKPTAQGTYFWGKKSFWIYRKQHHLFGVEQNAALFEVRLDSKGVILDLVEPDGTLAPLTQRGMLYLEPYQIAESLTEERLPRSSVPFSKFPVLLWQALLAAEDSRFFEHHGLDSKAIARSILRNAEAGKIVMGGSTLTQQLIKNRDLTPKRSLGRKASEAIRALALESEYEKDEILEAYMNHVYLGHENGVAIYGFPQAAEIFFSKSLDRLSIAECALLAGMVQGPNGLHPGKNPKRCEKRRNWVLSRMKLLQMIKESDFLEASQEKISVHIQSPLKSGNQHFLQWVQVFLSSEEKRHFKKGKGGWVYTTLDPILQGYAEVALDSTLTPLIGRGRGKSLESLEGALVSMDLETGGILAYSSFSTDPEKNGFDRVRLAKRQPGSTIKPFVLLTAFDRLHDPLFPGTLVMDSPFSLQEGKQTWKPRNYDARYHGLVSLRDALVFSYNIPFAKTARHIGFDSLGSLLNDLDLNTPMPPPPSISLGAIEVSPIQLLEAYSVFFLDGKKRNAIPVFGMDKPEGKKLAGFKSRKNRIARASSAYLVYDLMKDAMLRGTGQTAQLHEDWFAGKTGTSSNYRDGWFAGASGSVLTVVWVGSDHGQSIKLPSSQTAALVWKEFMERSVKMRPVYRVERPESVKSCKINPTTGLRVLGVLPGYREELYRTWGGPKRDMPWRAEAGSIIE